MNPQNATLASSTDHSEAFSESNLPWLATVAIISGRSLENPSTNRIIENTGKKSCGLRVTPASKHDKPTQLPAATELCGRNKSAQLSEELPG
jgi:hypothetical protein